MQTGACGDRLCVEELAHEGQVHVNDVRHVDLRCANGTPRCRGNRSDWHADVRIQLKEVHPLSKRDVIGALITD